MVLFPNQLFDLKILKKIVSPIDKIYFIEDPVFYGDRKGSPHASKLTLNSLRILFMKVLHERYVKLLKTAFDVEYISIDSLWNHVNYDFLPEECAIIDPCDHLLMSRLQKTKTQWKIIDSPSFLLSRALLAEYMKDRETKALQHSHFYEFSKEKLNILKDVSNQDIYNRAPYQKNILLPPNPYRFSYSKPEEWLHALEWFTSSPFKNNIGPKDWEHSINSYLIHLPLTHEQVRKWLKDFINHRLDTYGKFQDVVIPEQALLYHSGLSIYLNNGIITPTEIIEKVKKHPSDIRNSEGFLRQVIGWREYTRLYYLYVPVKIYRQNIFKQPKKSLSKIWYEGTTGIPIVDQTIKNAFQYGYINHIQRLMVMSNYMTLNNVHPDNIYKWMYEFSLDSYDWVMVFNCYSMGSWSDKGYAMRKPYISTSNYILKMTNAGRGEWQIKWDKLFYTFIREHKDIIQHTQLANLVK